MRNYIRELHENKVSIAAIAKATGIKQKRLSALSQGMVSLKSGTPEYERVRNLSRRLEYKALRETGLSPTQANKNRRLLFRPETLIKSSTRKIARRPRIEGQERKIDALQEFYQLRMIGQWQREVPPFEVRTIESFSTTHDKKFSIKEFVADFNEAGWETATEAGYGDAKHFEDAQDAIDECIIAARGQLEGSNWILIKILKLEWVKTVLQ